MFYLLSTPLSSLFIVVRHCSKHSEEKMLAIWHRAKTTLPKKLEDAIKVARSNHISIPTDIR